MNHYFETYAQKGNEFLDLLADELRCPEDIPRALRILRCVMHTVRNNVSPEVSLQFIAQLPMVIKAVYIEGWKLSEVRKKPLPTAEAFIREVLQSESGVLAQHDFAHREEVNRSVRAVFTTVRRYVSDGEWLDVVAVMPAAIRDLLMKSQPDRYHVL